MLNLHVIPLKKKDENTIPQQESFISALWKLRDQVSLFPNATCPPSLWSIKLFLLVKIWDTCKLSYISSLCQILSMKCPSFTRPVSEREWLKNSAKVWEQVRNSPIILEYCRTLHHSGMFRRQQIYKIQVFQVVLLHIISCTFLPAIQSWLVVIRINLSCVHSAFKLTNRHIICS